ncbi:MAG: hypothetical protein KGH53_03750 [Candidatus Micrarchaeota archaeon]|nr:hypothetical protein [Candidatus Micrarchaeota archaeon]
MIEWYYLIIISTILSVMVSIIQKRALKAEHATQYSAASSFLIALASLIFIPFANFAITPLQLLLNVLFGVLAAIILLMGTKIIRHSSISAIAPLSNVLPILFTVVLAYVFLAESLTLLQVVCIIGIAAITYLLLFRRIKGGLRRDFDSRKYKIMLVANALIGSIGGIIGKYLLVQINVFTFLIISQITAAICLGVYNSVKYEGRKGAIKTIEKYKFTFLALILLITTLRIIGYFALTVAPINIANTLSNAIFIMLTVPIGGILFKEGDLRRKMLLSGAILAFAYLLIVQ